MSMNGSDRLIREALAAVPPPDAQMMVNMPDGKGGMSTVPIEQAQVLLLDGIANRLDAVVRELVALRTELAARDGA